MGSGEDYLSTHSSTVVGRNMGECEKYVAGVQEAVALAVAD